MRTPPLRLLLALLITAATLAACSSDDGGSGGSRADTSAEADTSDDAATQADTATAEADTNTSTDTDTTPTCRYPANDGFLQMGKIMPELSWKRAYLGDGTQLTDFSLEEVFCGDAFKRYNAVFFFVSAEWCHACEEMLAASKDNDFFQEINANGGLPIILEVETKDYKPSPSSNAFATVSKLAGAPPGIIVGDADTAPARAPSVIMSSSLIGSFPGGFIVRKSDMRVISTLTDDENVYYDLIGIARDPDAYWDGTTPSDEPTCGPADEEASEPANNTPAGAATLALSQSINGGICDDAPDFYRVTYPGTWALELRFSRSDGDLDFLLWDEAANDFLLDANGRRIGSAGLGSNEFFSFRGPAVVRVFGYTGNTAKYRLTLVPLDD
jgi:hypothetical protein